MQSVHLVLQLAVLATALALAATQGLNVGLRDVQLEMKGAGVKEVPGLMLPVTRAQAEAGEAPAAEVDAAVDTAGDTAPAPRAPAGEHFQVLEALGTEHSADLIASVGAPCSVPCPVPVPAYTLWGTSAWWCLIRSACPNPLLPPPSPPQLPIAYYFDSLAGKFRLGIIGETLSLHTQELLSAINKRVMLKGQRKLDLQGVKVVDVQTVFMHGLSALQGLFQSGKKAETSLDSIARGVNREMQQTKVIEQLFEELRDELPVDVALQREVRACVCMSCHVMLCVPCIAY
jgi:hypothetical protein